MRKVLILFLLSSLLPVLILSGVMTWLSARVLRDVTGTNAAAGLEDCAVKVEEYTHTLSRRAVGLAADLNLLPVLDESIPAAASDTSLVMKRVRMRFPAGEAPLGISVVSLSGKKRFSTGEFPPDYDPGRYGSWGLVRKISSRPAGISLMAKAHRLVKENYTVLSLGTAVIGSSGRPVGYVIVDIPRETLRSALAPLPRLPDVLLADDTGCIAFCVASPELEGTYLEEGPETGMLVTPLAGGSLTLVGSLPVDLVNRLESIMRLVTVACISACVLLSLLVSYFLSRGLSRPVMKLLEATRRVADGDLSVRLEPEGSGEIAALMSGFNAMVRDIGALLDRTIEEQELLKRAELDALSSQMNPHFFFNALSSINALAKLGRTAEIVSVTTALGKLLRSSAGGRSRLCTIAESLAETRHYLDIERIRFGDRFSWVEDVEGALLGCTLPRLSIQSLVENALTHGIEPKPGTATLRISVKSDGDDVVIGVEDDGVGMSGPELAGYARLFRDGTAPSGTAHIGLLNTNRRLRLEYGEQYGLSLASRPGGGIAAAIRIPRREPPCTD